MSLTQLKVLTFDVVGTLIDFEAGIIGYMHSIAPPSASRLADDTILEAYRRSRADPSAGRYPDDLVRVYTDMERALDIPRKAGAAEGFRDSVANWPPFADSVEALRRLHARYRLVAMTNAQRWSLAHMARTLKEPFDDMVTVDDVGLEKPDPQFFAFARGRLSTQGFVMKDILHVAQSQYHDIGVARRLGYTVCWIERRKGLKGFGGTQVPEHVTKPDYHFATLAELADAVDAEYR